MDLPQIPALSPLESISPSFYEAGIICQARAAWQRFGDRCSLPSSTGSMLGSCFHAVMELGNKGQIPSGAEGLEMAKRVFDEKARWFFSQAHPLVKAKFNSPEKIPFYSLRRSRAAALAAKASSAVGSHAIAQQPTESTPPAGKASRLVEKTFTSRDGAITGKLDLLEANIGKLTDYKSGYAPKDNPLGMSEAEERQLMLYAYLAQQNDYAVTKASIVRGDGVEVATSVTATAVSCEAQGAKQMLQQFNSAVSDGRSFSEIATPSEGCANCPCIPFCDRFWEAAVPEWEDACGTNAEGKITATSDANLAGTNLRTITIDCTRGSAPRGELVAEQIPLEWLSLGSSVPGVGSTLRIVLAARSIADPKKRVLHVDRIKNTMVWQVAPARSVSSAAAQ